MKLNTGSFRRLKLLVAPDLLRCRFVIWLFQQAQYPKGRPLIAIFPLVFCILLIPGCIGAPQKAPAPPALPHLRYFESTISETGGENFTLYDCDLNNLSKNILWQLEDTNIDRIDMTPEGRFILVHYSILEELSQYYVIYDLDGPEPSTPLAFMRNNAETQRVSAYEASLDDGVYKYGFVIGDPDFKLLAEAPTIQAYRFAWVDLTSKTVEEIPLVTTMAEVPDIIFVPVGGGYFDFLRKGTPEILRFEWDSRDRAIMKMIYDPKHDPVLRADYIGSFSYFADFQKPAGRGNEEKVAKVGIRTPDKVIPLPQGDYPLWSLGDIYIFIRVFSPEVMDKIALGIDSSEVINALIKSGEKTKFAVYDLNNSERRETSLTLENPYAMPKPIYDIPSTLIATSDWGTATADTGTGSPVTSSIVVFNIGGDKTVAILSGIPSAVKTAIAFYRP
jgi:hypothetical protein